MLYQGGKLVLGFSTIGLSPFWSIDATESNLLNAPKMNGFEAVSVNDARDSAQPRQSMPKRRECG